MNDPRTDIWNTLHDGFVTVGARDGDALVLFVSAPYLRARFRPIGDSFALRLGAFRSARLRASNGDLSELDLDELPTCHLEILSAASTSMPVAVELTTGELLLDFDSLRIFLDTGAELPYSELRTQADRYWAEFEARALRPNTSLERTRER
jgi:hypothetical protein